MARNKADAAFFNDHSSTELKGPPIGSKTGILTSSLSDWWINVEYSLARWKHSDQVDGFTWTFLNFVALTPNNIFFNQCSRVLRWINKRLKVGLSPSKKNFFICFNAEKCFLFHLKSSFCSQDI